MSGASKLEFAYKSILSRILQGAYGPGYRLVIDELARDVNMGEVPVRVSMTRDVWRRVDVMRRSVFVHVPARARESVAAHERIIRLLEARSPVAETRARAPRRRAEYHAGYPPRWGAASRDCLLDRPDVPIRGVDS